MKRAIIRLTAEEFGRSPLNLGRADENIAVRVEIDLSRILAQEPTATAHINVQNPLGTEYAAVTSMDGTKLNSWEGTKIDSSGRTGLFKSTQTHIDNRTSSTAIVPTNFDYAVKAAMCDGKGAAWTDEERLAALLRLGCTVDDSGVVHWTSRGGS